MTPSPATVFAKETLSTAFPLPHIVICEEGWNIPPATEAHPPAAGSFSALSGQSPQRQAEFRAGRSALRTAACTLGISLSDIPAKASGAPELPASLVGSITHTRNYAAAAAARTTQVAALGLDTEPWQELNDQTLEYIATTEELQHLAALKAAKPKTPWGRILFTAKEATYKACSNLGISLKFSQSSIALGSPGIRISIVHQESNLLLTGQWCHRQEYDTILTLVWAHPETFRATASPGLPA